MTIQSLLMKPLDLLVLSFYRWSKAFYNPFPGFGAILLASMCVFSLMLGLVVVASNLLIPGLFEQLAQDRFARLALPTGVFIALWYVYGRRHRLARVIHASSVKSTILEYAFGPLVVVGSFALIALVA